LKIVLKLSSSVSIVACQLEDVVFNSFNPGEDELQGQRFQIHGYK